MFSIIDDYYSTFKKLSFLEKHSIISSLVTIVIAILFGVCSTAIAWVQLSIEFRQRREQKIEAQNQKNSKEAEFSSSVVFAISEFPGSIQNAKQPQNKDYSK